MQLLARLYCTYYYSIGIADPDGRVAGLVAWKAESKEKITLIVRNAPSTRFVRSVPVKRKERRGTAYARDDKFEIDDSCHTLDRVTI